MEGLRIFQIVSGGTFTYLGDWRIPILLEVQWGIVTTLLGDAPRECP